MLDLISDSGWNNHVELGMWADVMVIAPATANTMAKMANGICDNMITAVYLAARCPVFVAPAMDMDMWMHESTQRNLDLLQKDGCRVIPVAVGELASGLEGPGRMAEPQVIAEYLDDYFKKKDELRHTKVLVTAGPTFEPLDPVRYLGNRSSGKMGYHIASEMSQRGAEIDLILGPTSIPFPVNSSIRVQRVETAEEMYQKTVQVFPEKQIAVLAAAVSDFTPEKVSSSKIKKTGATLEVSLRRTKDIATEIAQIKQSFQIVVGFALETENELNNARNKLRDKKFDFIVLNSLRDAGAGFQHDTNKVTLLFADGSEKAFELKYKNEVAFDIVNEIVTLYQKKINAHEKN